MHLHSRVCTTNFSSKPEAQAKSGLGTLHGQHFILPLNVTLAIRSHLPRRWETVFRWTMKAIIGPRRSGEPLYSKREKTWWNPCVLMILMSASRDHPQTSFSTRAPWRFAVDHKSINSSEHARCARSSRQPMVCCARRPTRAGGGWMGGLHHQREDAAASKIREFFFIEEKKNNNNNNEILLRTLETDGLPFQHPPALQTKVFINILPSVRFRIHTF